MFSVRALLAALIGMLATATVQAEMVTVDEQTEESVFENVEFIEGTRGIVSAFDIATPGNYIARLTDFEFPTAFDELALTVVTSSASVGRVDGAGEFAFRVDTPGQFFAVVFGVAGGVGDLGLFGVEVVRVVPVPAAFVLFASAIATLVARRRRVAVQP